MRKELIERLRQWGCGNALGDLAAETIERLQNELAEQRSIAFAAQKEASRCAELERELQRKESTINTISNALSFAESECSRYRARAGELENENRRLLLDLAEAKELL